MKLYSHNFNGNIHQSCVVINRDWPDLIESLVHMSSTGRLTVAVFRVTDERYAELTDHWNGPYKEWELGQDR